MTTEEIIALSIKVKEGERARTELDKVGDSAERLGHKTEEASRKNEKTLSRWERTRKTMGRVRGAIAGVSAGLAAMGGALVTNAINRTQDMAKSTLGFAKVTDLDVKASAQWVEMAKLRGVDSKALSMGIVQMSKNQQAGLKHGSAQRKMFRDLGITQAQLKKTSPADMFGLIGDRLKGLKNPSQRNAIGVGLMGRSYLKLASLVLGGSDALKENMKQVENVGDAMGTMTKDQLANYIKTSRKADANMDAFRITIGLKLLPTVDRLVQKFTKMVDWMTKHKTATSILIGVLIAFAVALAIVNTALAIMAAIETVIAAPWIAVVLAIVAVIAIFVVLYNKVRWFRNAVDSTIRFIKKNWVKLIAIMTGPPGIIAYLIIKHWSKIVKFVKGLPGKIKRAASGMWDGFKDAFKSAINWIIRKWNGLKFKVPRVNLGPLGKLGGFTVGMPHVDELAEGGVVRGVGSWITGEAGPELNTRRSDGSVQVTPLAASAGVAAAGGGPMVIEFNSPLVLEHVNGDVLGRVVGRATADRRARIQGV